MLVLLSGWGLVVRRALHDRLVVAAAFATVVLATSLLAAVPTYGDAVALSGLRSTLAQAPPEQRGVEVDGSPAGGGYASLDEEVSEAARSTFAATGVRIFRGGESGPFSARGHGDRTFVLGFRDGLPAHATTVAGTLGAEAGGDVLGVAVDEASGLRLGQELALESRLDGGRVRARVTGVFRPAGSQSVYWWSPGAGSSVALLLPRQRFLGRDPAGSSFSWRLAPRVERLAADELPELRRQVGGLDERLNEGRPTGSRLAVYSDLDGVLADTAESLDAARASVLVPSSQLAVLAAYALLFTAGLLLERRAVSVEILRLRGATPGEVVALSAMEAVLVALPAAVVAPWLAAGLLRALNVVGPLASVGLTLRPSVGAASYALAFVAAAVAILALTVPALRARHVAIAAQRRRLPLAGLVQRSYLDLALAALALLGYWQLRRYRSPLLENAGGGAELDPFLIAAPALLLLAGALVALRLVPLAARLADRLSRASRGAVGALGPAQLARRPRRYTRAGLLLVLAIAIGIFAAAYTTTWDRSQADQAAYRAGADVRVTPSGADTAPPAIALAGSYRALPGVEQLSPAVRQEVDFTGAGAGTFLALDASSLPGIVDARSDAADDSLGSLARRVEGGDSRVPAIELPGKPTRIRLRVRFSAPGKAVRAPFGIVSARPLQAQLYLSLRDRDGLVHQIRLGDPHAGTLTADLVPPGSRFRPDYPLSLLSLQLSVSAPFQASSDVRFEISSFEAGAGGDLRPVRLGGADWQASAQAPPGLYRAPRVVSVEASGDTLGARFESGSVGSFFSRNETIDFHLQPGKTREPEPLRVLASDAYLTQTGARVGTRVELPLGSATYPARIVGSVHRFPTTDPDAPLVVADLQPFEAAALRIEGTTYDPDEWWLATRGDGTAAAEALRGPPRSSLDVVSRAGLERQLRDDPLSLGVIGALALGFVVAAAFAALGFALAAAVSARQRLPEYAVLRSLGVSTRELAGTVLVENGLLIGLSLLAGTGLGVVVAWAVLPFLALSASGGTVVPPVEVAVPWGTVVWIEVALLAALVAVAAAHVWVVARLRPAPVLRVAGSETA